MEKEAITDLFEGNYSFCKISKEGGGAFIAAARAESSKERRQGLLRQPSLPSGVALIISAAPLLHSLKMKFPIDVVWIRGNKIHKIVTCWRPSKPPVRASWAWTCLEMKADEAERLNWNVGDQLLIERDDNER